MGETVNPWAQEFAVIVVLAGTLLAPPSETTREKV
jgi:hypothetical protein